MQIVVVADDDPIEGKIAVKKLCDSYGKNRALFVHYDIKSDCHVQGKLISTKIMKYNNKKEIKYSITITSNIYNASITTNFILSSF